MWDGGLKGRPGALSRLPLPGTALFPQTMGGGHGGGRSPRTASTLTELAQQKKPLQQERARPRSASDQGTEQASCSSLALITNGAGSHNERLINKMAARAQAPAAWCHRCPSGAWHGNCSSWTRGPAERGTAMQLRAAAFIVHFIRRKHSHHRLRAPPQ